jgi:hypothetical protein
MEQTYSHLRELAIVDANRRLKTVIDKIPGWNIVDRTHTNGDIEKTLVYKPTLSLLTSLSLNMYGQIRELKYIVWRFNISKEELMRDSDATQVKELGK